MIPMPASTTYKVLTKEHSISTPPPPPLPLPPPLPPPALIRSASVGYLSIKLPASHKGSTISLEQAGSVLFVKYPNNLKAPQEHQTAPRVLSYTL